VPTADNGRITHRATPHTMNIAQDGRAYVLTVRNAGSYTLDVINARGSIVESFSGFGNASHRTAVSHGLYTLRLRSDAGIQTRTVIMTR